MNWKNIVIFILVILVIAMSGEKQMQFSDILAKMANGEQLTPAEKDTLLLEARRMQETASLITSMVQPGTGTLKVDHLIANDAKISSAEILNATAGNGAIEIGSNGIRVKNTSQALITFQDHNNLYGYLNIGSSNVGNLGLYVNNPSKRIDLWTLMTNSDRTGVNVGEDGAQANRSLVTILEGNQGTRLNLGSNAKIDMRTEGTAGGSTFMRMIETTNTPPGGGADAFHMYMKGDKLIIQFNASSVAHYFYLDMTATTNQSWIYSATAP